MNHPYLEYASRSGQVDEHLQGLTFDLPGEHLPLENEIGAVCVAALPVLSLRSHRQMPQRGRLGGRHLAQVCVESVGELVGIAQLDAELRIRTVQCLEQLAEPT